MAKRDWEEMHNSKFNYGKFATITDDPFFPSETFKNPFLGTAENFSATQFNKPKPGSWIPLYKSSELSEYFTTNKVYPVRAGQAEFFFYRGDIFFNLQEVNYTAISPNDYQAIETFVPHTLSVKFERNENAYLNKAVALGIINHFVDGDHYSVLEKTIQNKTNTRLLYGQFGKIKLTTPLTFKTSKGNKTINAGFQFEIDLVLENEKEIIIFEAKAGSKPQKTFSLLQLYYPLIYFRQLLGNEKKIRTVFIDIIANDKKEEYQLVEVIFSGNYFNDIKVVKSFYYDS